MTPQSAYDELILRSKQIYLLGSCAEVLEWEEQTFMPPGGAEHRGNQLALLAGMRHERLTDPRLGELLAAVENTDLVSDRLSPPAVNVRELRRSFDRAVRIPQTLVEEIAKTSSLAHVQWVKARKEKDFAAFEPWLDKMIGLKRKEAEALGYEDEIYDALLDDYEPGALTKEVRALFAELRDELVPLVGAIADASRRPKTEIVARTYPVDRQRLFGETAAAAIGFDFQKGRLDTAAHPFCSGFGPGDCRLTTRYDPNNFNDAFFSTLHEAGHGLYEQGLDDEHYGTPMGDAVSLGVHESQSRTWENEVGRNHGFWKYFFPQAQRMFPSALHDVKLDDFHFAVNTVEPSFIRVDADEVTYNLHIMVRFELEQALLAGELSASDVPAAWNEKYADYLGISPPDDAKGCLQDVHWSAGLFGYFPTYTLGNVYGAQLFKTAAEELGDLPGDFARGDFRPLLDWLREKIHRQGQRYRSKELVETVTGAAPVHQPLMTLLRSQYGELYGV